MIIQVFVDLKEVYRLGRNFSWPRPDKCPECNDSGLWGHGFAFVNFDGFPTAIPLKRWRCPHCGCVIRCRPKGYFSRFQASVATIRSAISHRIRYGRWPPGMNRSRPGHWLRSLKKRVITFLGNEWRNRLLEAFDHFIHSGQIPVSRSI